MTARWGAALAVAVALALLAVACSPDRRSTGGEEASRSSSSDSSPAASSAGLVEGAGARSGPPPVYVAVGASETTGIGADVPLREAWPRVLFRTAMPENTIFVNLGIPGATVAQALREELPRALEQRPTIVTVWLNVNDIMCGVPPADFERDLAALLG